MTIGINVNQVLSDLFTSRYTNEVSDSIQRLTSGLRINDTSDDVGGLVSYNSLNTISSSLQQGIENANSGLSLVQISSKALSSQLDILNSIKDRLDVAKYDSTDATSKDAIRLDIIDLISNLDDIASNVNYNNIYTLQKSDTDTDYSLATTITIDSDSNTSITTQSIKSNSEGLSLEDLKNLTSGELTQEESLAQLDVIDAAISTINTNSESFGLSQIEIKISIENLTNIEKSTSDAKDSILKADITEENAVLDKYKLLEKSSEFAIVQANITQSAVLKLLVTPIETVDYSKDNKDTQINPDKSEEDYSYDNSNDNYSNTSYGTNTSYNSNSNTYDNNNTNDTTSTSTNTNTST